MSEVNCIICNQNKSELLTISNGFDLVKCKNDGLVYVNPQPSEADFKKFYEAQEYFSRGERDVIGYANYLAEKPAIIKNSNRIINEIKKFCSRGKLFDIGCAFGFTLDVARKMGFEVYGNDLNEEAIKYAKEVLHLNNVYAGYMDQSGDLSGSFDAVIMAGTIEHFQNPQIETDKAKQLLKPGGILAILTADFDSLIGRGSIKPPEHLYYFSRKNMRFFLENSGFEILKMIPQFLPNVFYFTVEDFTIRFFDYFYRLTDSQFLKKILSGFKKMLLSSIRKIGIASWVIPAIDGQFLTIAKKI